MGHRYYTLARVSFNLRLSQEKRAQEHQQTQLDRNYEKQAVARSVERRKATEERVQIAEEDSKARGAAKQSIETPKKIWSNQHWYLGNQRYWSNQN